MIHNSDDENEALLAVYQQIAIPQTPIGHRLCRLVSNDLLLIGGQYGRGPIIKIRAWRWLAILANKNRRFGPLLPIPNDAERN